MKAKRIERGTITKIADVYGSSRSCISAYRTGQKPISLDTARKLIPAIHAATGILNTVEEVLNPKKHGNKCPLFWPVAVKNWRRG